MGKPYIPIFFDWTETTAELKEDEKGRLIDALICYAKGEPWQSHIIGNERFVFPVFRAIVDRSNLISARRRVAGSNGGNQKKANYSKRKQTQANATEEEEEEEEEKEKEEEYIRPQLARTYEEWRRRKNAEAQKTKEAKDGTAY